MFGAGIPSGIIHPTEISDCQVFLDCDPDTMYSDTGFTTLATLDVRGWKNIGGYTTFPGGRQFFDAAYNPHLTAVGDNAYLDFYEPDKRRFADTTYSFAATGVIPNNTFTFALCYRYDTTASNDECVLYGFKTSGGSVIALQADTGTSPNQITFYDSASGLTDATLASGSVQDNNWRMVIVTRDGADYKMYDAGLNLDDSVTKTTTHWTGTVTSFYMGRRHNTGTFWDGAVLFAGHWNKVLSTPEMQSLVDYAEASLGSSLST